MPELVVDVDGVVLRGGITHWSSDLEADFGFSAQSLQQAFFKPFWHQVVTGKVPIETHLAPVLASIAPDVSVERFLDYWFAKDSLLNQKFLEDVDTIRTNGTKVYLGTNQDHRRAKYIMTELGLDRHFDGIFFSAAIGHKKPTPEFYAHVEQVLGVPGREIIFVDDTLENVEAARHRNWQSVHWTGDKNLLNEIIHWV
jgi:putative hydrolase of the HAD superfamily